MLRKQWQDYALKAKQIAKHIVTGLEQNKKGVRLIQIVYGLDMYATDALNLKYSKQRSKSSVHTYQGGRQEISTQHADGSEGLFKSNGEFQPTNNPMDTEVEEYMNNNLDENKQYKTYRNMNKKLIRLTESDLHRIVKESVNRILKEYSDDYGIESDYDFYGTYGNPSQYIRNSEADFDGQAGRSRDLFPYKRGLASLSAQSEKPKEWRGDDLQYVDEPDDEAWSAKINGRAGISPKIARMEKGWDKAFNPNKADIVYHGNDEDNINHATWDN